MLEIIQNQLPIIISDNYKLRRIGKNDQKDMFEIYSNEKISKYVSNKVHTSIKDTEEFIDLIDERIKAGTNVYLGICDISSDKLIGIIRFLRKEDPEILTIGYALNEIYWGKGIVPGALIKLIELIKVDGEFLGLRATVRPENIKSKRCLQKLGFEMAGSFFKNEIVEGKIIESERLLYYKVL